MTPLCALLRSYHGWIPASSDLAQSEIMTEAAGLLWNLCEASPTAVGVYNREDITALLINLLSSSSSCYGSSQCCCSVQ